MEELVGKLVSGLEKEKPSPISPYLFHFYGKLFLSFPSLQQVV